MKKTSKNLSKTLQESIDLTNKNMPLLLVMVFLEVSTTISVLNKGNVAIGIITAILSIFYIGFDFALPVFITTFIEKKVFNGSEVISTSLRILLRVILPAIGLGVLAGAVMILLMQVLKLDVNTSKIVNILIFCTAYGVIPFTSVYFSVEKQKFGRALGNGIELTKKNSNLFLIIAGATVLRSLAVDFIPNIPAVALVVLSLVCAYFYLFTTYAVVLEYRKDKGMK